MPTLRSLRMFPVLAVATSAVVPALGGTPTFATSQPYPVEYIADADQLLDLSADGRWLLAEDTGADRTFRADTTTGATVTLPGSSGFNDRPAAISDDGAVYWWRCCTPYDSGSLRRTVVGGGTTSYGNPFDSPIDGELWVFTGVVDVAGASVILSASNGVYGNWTFDYDPASGVIERIIPESVSEPTEHEPSLGATHTSPDGIWITFWSSADDVVPGLTGSEPRLFRRHIPSGTTHLVGNFATPSNVGPIMFNRGLVALIVHEAGGSQLYAWNRPGAAPQQVTVGPDGEAPDGGLQLGEGSVQASSDSMRLVFASTASNLAGPLSASGSRAYVATLPASFPNPDSIIGAGTTRCFDAQGADPGDIVALNATPIQATNRGYGTLHSSDDSAGDTSNVNFATGTVDPNLALTPVGTDGQVCFTNSNDGPVHLVLDQLIVADGSVFTSPTPDGAARLADTRFSD